jgi:transcriptional regulator with XRE-family HTH domain
MYPKELRTLGDHIRFERLKRRMYLGNLVMKLDVSPETIINWEKNRTKPPVHFWPRIISFLGYCPHQRAETFGDRLKLHRIFQGWSYRELAEK